MNIQEVEKRTGVPKQNIRFYEKEGLITPKRNEENGYRKFSEEDIERIKLIKLLRKLDFPLGKIAELLEGQLELYQAVDDQIRQLEERNKELEACIAFCKELREEPVLKDIDLDYYLQDMHEKEKAGNKFFDFLSDVKAVYQAELEKKFEFQPHMIVRNAREVTDALFEYADKNDHMLVITKEGMYPEFTLDGAEYIGECVYSRFGVVIKCRRKNPEEVEPEYIPVRKRRRYQKLIAAVSVCLMFLFFFLFMLSDATLEGYALAALCSGAVVAFWLAMIRTHPTRFDKK